VSDNAMKRLRRLLLLLPAVGGAERRGDGLPLVRAVEITGARDEQELMDDVEAVRGLWVDPGVDEGAIDLYVEDGQVHVTYVHAFATPPTFSLAEAAVLRSALEPFGKVGGRPVQGAIRKLRRAVPQILRDEADRLARGHDLALIPPGLWAGALREAIEKHVETTIEYRAVSDETATRRVVEPRLLLHRNGQWYLAAWNIGKEEEHLFRLDRIVAVELGTRVFGAHKGPPVGRYGERLFFESGAEREVTIRLSGAAARLARERGLQPRENVDGTVSVSSKVSPGSYLFGVLLGHGGEATLEGPPDVVAAFQSRVADLARLYA